MLWGSRKRQLQKEIDAVHKESNEIKRAAEELQPIVDEALRRRDDAVERSRQASRKIEEVISAAIREGLGHD